MWVRISDTKGAWNSNNSVYISVISQDSDSKCVWKQYFLVRLLTMSEIRNVCKPNSYVSDIHTSSDFGRYLFKLASSDHLAFLGFIMSIMGQLLSFLHRNLLVTIFDNRHAILRSYQRKTSKIFCIAKQNNFWTTEPLSFLHLFSIFLSIISIWAGAG